MVAARTDRTLTYADVDRLKREIEDALPSGLTLPVLVCSDGLTLEVLRPDAD